MQMHKVIDYSIQFWDELAKNADTNNIFTGSLTTMYNRVGCSKTYYAQIRALLTRSGAMEVSERGAGSSPSVVTLHFRPEPNALENLRQGLTPLTGAGTLAERVEIQGARITALEEKLQGLDVLSVLRNHEGRLAAREAIETTTATTTKVTEREGDGKT